VSLNTIMSAATSGLNAAQTGLRVVSDNIANINTPGYVRKQALQTSLVSQGMGVGVDIAQVRRAADTYLQGASLLASSDAGRHGAVAEGLDRAQGLFGDPSGSDTFFDKLEKVWSSFSAASDDPTSTLARVQALEALQGFTNDSASISNGLSALSQNADTQITADVARVNDLLVRIQAANVDIMHGRLSGADATGSENIQSNLLDELSSLMNVAVTQRPDGGVNVRSTEGYILAGEGAATLSYTKSQGAEGYITASLPLGSGQPVRIGVSSGELKGLLQLRNTELPGLSAQLGEFASKAAQEINRAANASSAAPAPASLTGRNTGLTQAEALSNFTGKTNIVVTNAGGVVVRRIEIDFDNENIRVDGSATTTPFAAPDNLIDVLKSAAGLDTFGDIDFTNGKMTLSASNAGQGISVVDDATTPSMKAGMGFSHFFGLNDIIRSDGPSTYATGMDASSPHDFSTGAITLRLMGADGARLTDVTVSPVAGEDMQDLLDDLNSVTGGVGSYGQFSLDANGEMSFAPFGSSGVTMSLVSDNTRNSAGFSMSQMFGIGPAERGGRAQRLSVDGALKARPALLPFSQVDLTVAGGMPALTPGDGRGALALAKAGENAVGFPAAGGLGSMSASLSRYAMEMSGDIARKASSAEGAKDAAEATKTEADSQRSSVEGVSLDEELINMTTYQQAYNASARLIQAAKDMYDVLVQLI
jgi:flagellar hook-associated protein 1 FlgK